ncbi:MAG: D-alanine--D-alanine ligase [Bacteroidales bacterium]
MKKNIGILYGGPSAESEISAKSAKTIYDAVDKERYNVWNVEIDGTDWKLYLNEYCSVELQTNDFTFELNGKKVRLDYVFNTVHGQYGEDGVIQGVLDWFNISYNTGGVTSSALTYNKYFCSQYLKSHGVMVPNAKRLVRGVKYDQVMLLKDFSFPIIVKPNLGGSSFGLSMVDSDATFDRAVENAFKYCDEVVVEEFIKGRELTCGIVSVGGESTVLPITEIVAERGLFDYDAKYNDSGIKEITPAQVSSEIETECKRIVSEVYNLCNCKGIARVDFMLKDSQLYFLEINITPGMTKTSLVPQQLRSMNIDLSELISRIIEADLNRSSWNR